MAVGFRLDKVVEYKFQYPSDVAGSAGLPAGPGDGGLAVWINIDVKSELSVPADTCSRYAPIRCGCVVELC